MASFSDKSYKAKVEAIFTRFPSIQKVSFSEAYKPGLEHMLEFAEGLGNPHAAFRTIHVAGTNGKGSVANMLASVLASAGLKVGLYTSPHIVDFRERMRIKEGDSAPVRLAPKDYVYDFLCTNEALMDRLDLSFFEITTGLAFKWFADERVDVAVIEVGLGGRLDSTNIITPDLSIVTSIALDHCALLGSTVAEIAREKAGIFKAGVPALVGEYLPETKPVFTEVAEGLCPLTFAQDGEPSLWHRNQSILKRMDLQGKYQYMNLRTVLAAVDILASHPGYSEAMASADVEEAVRKTAARMEFHGRWECLSHHPRVIADIGHNPAALKENFAQLEAMLEEGSCSSLIIVYAVMADKDLDGIMPLMPRNATYIFTNPSTRRALPEGELAARYREFCAETGRSTSRVYDASSVKEALDMAMRLSRASVGRDGAEPLVYVGGSTYLVSEAVEVLRPSRNM